MGHQRAQRDERDALEVRAAGRHPTGPAQAHLWLQRHAGNRAVCGLVRRQGDGPGATVQRTNDTGLPDGLKAGIESSSGMSLDAVRVHYNSARPAEVGALAYTQGTEIHVGPGQERHLAHEAWHVVQQAQGRVRPTRQLKDGMSVNDEQGLEREADVMGARAQAQVGVARTDEVPAGR